MAPCFYKLVDVCNTFKCLTPMFTLVLVVALVDTCTCNNMQESATVQLCTHNIAIIKYRQARLLTRTACSRCNFAWIIRCKTTRIRTCTYSDQYGFARLQFVTSIVLYDFAGYESVHVLNDTNLHQRQTIHICGRKKRFWIRIRADRCWSIPSELQGRNMHVSSAADSQAQHHCMCQDWR